MIKYTLSISYMNILNTILDIIFPVYCIECNKPGNEICLNCIVKIKTIESETPEWIYCVYNYRDPIIKKALWLLKYNKMKNFANIFAQILYANIIEELSELSTFKNFYNPILIPIPISKKRRKERGYNQAELICEALIKIDQKNTQANKTFILEKDVLIKAKDTTHQAEIKNRKERLENIIGTFDIQNADKIKKRNIILIDDITTTGATLSEAKKVLKKAGANKIIAFTVAH